MTKPLRDYALEWQHNAERDPLCAILSFPERKEGGWRLDEFFRTGEQEIGAVFDALARRGLEPAHGAFLDFGCGAGRLSRALRRRFESGCGVDIAPAMIALAETHVPDVTFRVNQDPDLRCFADGRFDFVYSHITLQHLPSPLQERYIRELVRVTRPGGLCVFQVISGIVFPSEGKRRRHQVRARWRQTRLYRLLARFRHRPIKMELHVLRHARVLALSRETGCRVEAQLASNSCEASLRDGLVLHIDVAAHLRALEGKPGKTYVSRFYVLRR